MTITIALRTDVRRCFLDTEFMEDGATIELLSLGVVDDVGREYYGVNREADHRKANAWVRAHVLPLLPTAPDDPAWRTRAQLRDDLAEFLDEGSRAEVWAYYGSYDHVVVCQLFGRMVDLPPHVPMYFMDLKQLSVLLGSPPHPPQAEAAHHALHDARWNKQLFEHLRRAPR
jgi:hypothetical protein